MSAYDTVGADGQSYPEVAAQAVRSIHAQHRSPYYGYIRSGINQKIYLFPLLEDARAWFGQHVQLQPVHDYAAVFSATDLRSPVAGMEHFMRANESGDPSVGNWWPLLIGLPIGALGGYFFNDIRRWLGVRKGVEQAVEQMKTVGGPWLDMIGQDYGYGGYSDGYSVGGPWVDLVGQYGNADGYSDGYSDGYAVGGPWVDLVGQYGNADGYSDDGYSDGYAVGGPWVDLVGQNYGYGDHAIGCPPYTVGAEGDDAARRGAWPQTKALIQSAISDVTSYAASYPAEAYVWTLDAPASTPYAGRAPGSVVMLEGTTSIVPFSSQHQALDYLREVAQTRPVALAMFERSSPHWPNPVAWRKSAEPDHESVIAQHVASRSTTQTSGAYVGADTKVNDAIAAVRERAQALADRRAGNVIGVIHTSKDGLWHTLAFRSSDDADDWLGTATHDPASYTYAAYYDKEDFQWPHPVNEKIGGSRTPSRPGLDRVKREIATSGEWWAA